MPWGDGGRGKGHVGKLFFSLVRMRAVVTNENALQETAESRDSFEVLRSGGGKYTARRRGAHMNGFAIMCACVEGVAAKVAVAEELLHLAYKMVFTSSPD